MNEIDTALADTSKWSGDAHDQSVNGQSLIRDYTGIIKGLLFQLEAGLAALDTNVGQFENASRTVKSWEAW